MFLRITTDKKQIPQVSGEQKQASYTHILYPNESTLWIKGNTHQRRPIPIQFSGLDGTLQKSRNFITFTHLGSCTLTTFTREAA